ncbi:arginine--tRNA ligase [Gammaproteobacteria bacterium]|jgi:arginyl-tRNA synthetase|nr:arginine--tRNA ligase [Gammaproteobacteria bacterium]MCH9855102.1 arginine--tRNA ligase [Gammaproteobacteria bacterium]MDA9129673.1 arginine--tRNA ligase [Gammaproteobacteria bacterium]MDB0060791.1 arginine--tRNA ligase [Gammaproteobacteria bacterium]
MHTLKRTLTDFIGAELATLTGLDEVNPNVITASKPEFGDYQANGVMGIAKRLGRNPRELGTELLARLNAAANPLVSHYELAGPGFINIHLAGDALRDRANELLVEPRLLVLQTESPQTIVVDYSSPNLAKEMHVGHLRGTIIGDSIARILERQGNRVIRQNHVGDWGTQFGMLITFMRESSAEAGVALADLEGFYRAAKQRFDADSEFADRARESVVKLQGGDPEYLEAWQAFISTSLTHCQAVYDKLNVTLSMTDLKAESFYNPQLEGVVTRLENTGLLKDSDGARCVFLDEFVGKDGEPLPVIIQKTDGGYLYATTDLAAVDYRCHELKADRSLYVVDARQSLHFQQVFAVAAAAGFSDEAISLEHISYGTMMGSDGKPFKTRSGDVVKLVDLLDEAVTRAFDLVSSKNPDLEEAERRHIAEAVGIAAVKYADLSKNRTSDYLFDWSSMLSFEGNTAPYLMYAYARIRTLLAKQTVDTDGIIRFPESVALAPEEKALLLKSLQLAETIDAVAQDCFPNTLSNYLYELSASFMRFYEACPIQGTDAATRANRLSLCVLASEALKQGLDLLGIETLERM